jgi:hypothetical protein
MSFLAQQLLRAGGADPLTVSVGGSAGSNANSSSYTFSSVSVPDGDYLVIALMTATSNAGMTVSSITVNGVAVDHIELFGASFTGRGFAIIAHPHTGTVSIVVSFSSGALRCYVQTYAIEGNLQSVTPDSAPEDISTPLSLTANIPAGGVLFAQTFNSTISALGFSDGVTVDYAAAQESTIYYSTGHYMAENAEPAHGVSSDADSAIYAVVWR